MPERLPVAVPNSEVGRSFALRGHVCRDFDRVVSRQDRGNDFALAEVDSENRGPRDGEKKKHCFGAVKLSIFSRFGIVVGLFWPLARAGARVRVAA